MPTNSVFCLGLCIKCSKKLNYRFKRKEVKRLVTAKKPVASQFEKIQENAAEASAPEVSTSFSNEVWRTDEPPAEDKEHPDEQDIDSFLQDLFF